VLEALLLLM